MKVGIPVDENDANTSICPSFGRSPYCMIYDSVTKTCEIIENASADQSGGVGILVAQFYVDQQVDAIITPRLGKNAADVFRKGNIKIYKSKGKDAMESVGQLLTHELELLNEFHGGFHGSHS